MSGPELQPEPETESEPEPEPESEPEPEPEPKPEPDPRIHKGPMNLDFSVLNNIRNNANDYWR